MGNAAPDMVPIPGCLVLGRSKPYLCTTCTAYPLPSTRSGTCLTQQQKQHSLLINSQPNSTHPESGKKTQTGNANHACHKLSQHITAAVELHLVGETPRQPSDS